MYLRKGNTDTGRNKIVGTSILKLAMVKNSLKFVKKFVKKICQKYLSKKIVKRIRQKNLKETKKKTLRNKVTWSPFFMLPISVLRSSTRPASERRA